MTVMQEKSFFVLEYTKCSSVTSVQRASLRKYEKAAPGHQSILRWFRQFCETGCMCKGKSMGLNGVPLLPWLLRSPDLTPCDFFLPVGLCEGQGLCTSNANNAASTAGTHRCCDGHRQKRAIEHLDRTGLPLGCVSGDQGHKH
ncbi:hypothetical protein AVEN_119468-1 [Araneus ventricosus]|uniref:Uncharacterized protein n=1 Tax=Araneus ventricosus TaxID=182803 RepID=A0A4Y2DKV1_ARAVE|nr:hypothetical protein AVEN_119468-1 [Araneus ventricosus]